MDKCETWLKNPVHSGIEEAILAGDALLVALQSAMRQEDAPKKRLGSLIGRVRSLQKTLHGVESIPWVPFINGAMALGHRPGSKRVGDLKLQHASHMLTLLSEKEGALQIKGLAERSGLGWLWFPMTSADPPGKKRLADLASLFEEMEALLTAGGKLYIHCSAGIHRTGMIAYAFMRFLGMDEHAAKVNLEELRAVTHDGVGAERLAWGDSIRETLQKLSL